MASQAAKKSGRLQNIRLNVSGEMAYKDVVPMNKWKLEQEYGAETTKEWIDSKKLPYEKDPVTHSDAPHMRIYQVPIAWTRGSAGHEDKQELSAESVATDKDIENFDSMRTPVATEATGSAGAVVVKVEKTAADIEAEKVAAFDAKREEVIIELSTATTHLKLLEVSAAGHPLTLAISEAGAKLRKKTEKLLRAVEEYHKSPSSVKTNGVIVLATQCDVNFVERADLQAWATRNCISSTLASPSTGTKRKRKA